MSAPKKPWLKWYPSDWRGDPKLRMCSYAGRGLWADLMSYMHEGEPYGHLTIDGRIPSVEEIASLCGRPVKETRQTLDELRAKGVSSVDENTGAIFSRRMVRDHEKASKDRANGRSGGNPKLTEGVNPPVNGQDKAHIPEARDQKEIDSAAALRLEFCEAIRVDRDDPEWVGCGYWLEHLLSRGFTRETILSAASNVMRGRKGRPPPQNYFTKAIETENNERSAPAKQERTHGNAGKNPVIAEADNLVAYFDRFNQPAPGDDLAIPDFLDRTREVRSGEGAPPLRAISNR